MGNIIEVCLENVCKLVTDGTHDTPKRVVNGYPLIKAKEIIGGYIDYDNCEQISEEEHLKVVARSKPEFGDILFAHIGATLGEAALVKIKKPFSIKNIALFKPNPKIISGPYLYYLTISPSFQALAKLSRTGSAQPFLSLGQLRSHRINYHESLLDQNKIAAILSAYDDLIENNQRRIKILEEMAQNLYREWFVNFRFPGHEKTYFADSPLGRIPEGWEIVDLEDIADQIRNSIKPETLKPDTPYVGLEHIPRRSITLTCWGHASEVQSIKYVFENRDILFGKIRPYFHKVVVAPLSGICSSDTIVIRVKSIDYFGMVLSCTSSAEFVEHAAATSQGTKMPRANWDVLMKYQIPFPPQPILDYFNNAINDIIKLLQSLVFININLRQTRDLLLPKLISGEVDVSEIDINVSEEEAV